MAGTVAQLNTRRTLAYYLPESGQWLVLVGGLIRYFIRRITDCVGGLMHYLLGRLLGSFCGFFGHLSRGLTGRLAGLLYVLASILDVVLSTLLLGRQHHCEGSNQSG